MPAPNYFCLRLSVDCISSSPHLFQRVVSAYAAEAARSPIRGTLCGGVQNSGVKLRVAPRAQTWSGSGSGCAGLSLGDVHDVEVQVRA